MIAGTGSHPLLVIITIGLAMAASPFGILAIVVMLGTTKPLANGWSFAAGWMVSITAVGLFTAWLTNQGGQGGTGSSSGSAAIQGAIGIALLVGGAIMWRRRHQGAGGAPPKWMQRAEHISPFLAFVLGLFLPTWALIAPVVDQIEKANVSEGAALAAYGVFVVAASMGLLIPLVIFTLRRAWAESMLGAWKAWLLANSSSVIAILLLVLGALFLSRSVASLL
jgi:Sap, sulfolipid-1-addressing protein